MGVQPCGGISLSDVGKMSGKRHSGLLCDLCIKGKERKVHTQAQKQAAIDRLAGARRDRTAVRGHESEQMSICKAVAAVAADANPFREGYAV
jgi:hypothetical protein